MTVRCQPCLVTNCQFLAHRFRYGFRSTRHDCAMPTMSWTTPVIPGS